MWYMNEDREMLANAFREFAEKEIRPFIPKMEEKEEHPKELLAKMGELGMLGLCIDEEYGGAGADFVNYGLMLEEVSKESHSFGLLTFLATQLTIGLIHKLCTPEQVDKFVKPAINGEILLSIVATEPGGASNAPEYETRAVLDGDEWVINGGKILITNADTADVHLVQCVTGDKVDPITMDGVSLIAIPANTKGFTVGHMEKKLGWKGSHTGQVYFNDCRVPKDNLIGELNKAQMTIQLILGSEFSAYGPMNLGSMEAVYEKTMSFVKSRMQGGKSLWDTHQVLRNDMAKMWIKIDNYRNAVYSVLENRNRGENIIAQSIALKVEGEEILEHIASQCIELHGGTGTVYETGIERYYRDAKMGALGCGSNKTMIDSLSGLI